MLKSQHWINAPELDIGTVASDISMRPADDATEASGRVNNLKEPALYTRSAKELTAKQASTNTGPNERQWADGLANSGSDATNATVLPRFKCTERLHIFGSP